MTTTKRPPACHWDTSRGWLTPEHQRDCDDHECRGCRPCPKVHCAMRGRCPSHVDAEVGHRTCPGCIGRTRADLEAIEQLHAIALPEEALEAGIESEAFALAGPAARYSAAPAVAMVDDEHHPYTVLGRLDLAAREIYGPQTDLRITVPRSAAYLRGLLDHGPYAHGDEFEETARDLADCRAHLEAVVHDSRAPERGRPCPRCAETHGKAPRLQKRYAAGEGLEAAARDTWHCPAEPEHWWTEQDYRDKVAVDYVRHAGELPAKELAGRIGVALSTLRKWTARTWDPDQEEWTPPRLVSCRRGPDGRKIYPVREALRLAEQRAS